MAAPNRGASGNSSGNTSGRVVGDAVQAEAGHSATTVTTERYAHAAIFRLVSKVRRRLPALTVLSSTQTQVPTPTPMPAGVVVADDGIVSSSGGSPGDGDGDGDGNGVGDGDGDGSPNPKPKPEPTKAADDLTNTRTDAHISATTAADGSRATMSTDVGIDSATSSINSAASPTLLGPEIEGITYTVDFFNGDGKRIQRQLILNDSLLNGEVGSEELSAFQPLSCSRLVELKTMTINSSTTLVVGGSQGYLALANFNFKCIYENNSRVPGSADKNNRIGVSACTPLRCSISNQKRIGSTGVVEQVTLQTPTPVHHPDSTVICSTSQTIKVGGRLLQLFAAGDSFGVVSLWTVDTIDTAAIDGHTAQPVFLDSLNIRSLDPRLEVVKEGEGLPPYIPRGAEVYQCSSESVSQSVSSLEMCDGSSVTSMPPDTSTSTSPRNSLSNIAAAPSPSSSVVSLLYEHPFYGDRGGRESVKSLKFSPEAGILAVGTDYRLILLALKMPLDPVPTVPGALLGATGSDLTQPQMRALPRYPPLSSPPLPSPLVPYATLPSSPLHLSSL